MNLILRVLLFVPVILAYIGEYGRSRMASILQENKLAYSSLFPTEWKNSKTNAAEERENEDMLSNILASGGKRAYNDLVEKIHELDRNNRKAKKADENVLNLTCWIYDEDNCTKKNNNKELNGVLESDPGFLMERAKHYAYLDRKFTI
ncbi:hypothetical protein VCUG_00867 [Vavraia culicis subsp. floridensis]|uniref:Uncharacterized protein n=1 Tax=Vavraia culicis (isolate floridensis) TaxID=948595 RepID=L2GVG7_VAVCU|nr:uncharacterized protein VCUG_00867 [Vavraia culicis subsp. floridensis]ELA47666.1 hypothetical protein VCUG_00867 [Vavraia culicis subsp. floridensis]